MFVSESKFQSAPADFIPHILANPPNREALAALITKPAVEARLLVRLANKAKVYGCEMDADGHVIGDTASRIDIEAVVGLYRDWVIPLTKDVEVSGCAGRRRGDGPKGRARGGGTDGPEKGGGDRRATKGGTDRMEWVGRRTLTPGRLPRAPASGSAAGAD